MSFNAKTDWEVRTTGSDNNGGGCQWSQQGFDLASDSVSNTKVSSASYTFVAGDVNKTVWIYTGAGGWTAGKYKITAVSAGVATLDASVGGTSLTKGSWRMMAGTDYSSQDSPQVVIDGTTISAVVASNSLFMTLTGYTVSSADIGNMVNITGGTGTHQRYQITAVNTGSNQWNLDKTCGTAGQTLIGNLGGALGTPGYAASQGNANGHNIFVKAGTYTINSASTNVAGGCVNLSGNSSSAIIRIIGFQTTRWDGGTKPLLQASGISTFTLLSLASARADNLSLDGAGLTSSRGVTLGGITNSEIYNCKIANCTNNAVSAGTSSPVVGCEATGCSTQPAFSSGACVGCTAHNNTVTGFNNVSVCVDCASTNNTGASSNGFSLTAQNLCVNCLAYGNGQHGFAIGTQGVLVNCRAEANVGTGFQASSATDNAALYTCAAWSNGTDYSSNLTPVIQVSCLTASGDPSSTAASNNFALNSTPGAGAALRAAGFPSSLPGLSTSSYPDIGPAQSQGGAAAINRGIRSGGRM